MSPCSIIFCTVPYFKGTAYRSTNAMSVLHVVFSFGGLCFLLQLALVIVLSLTLRYSSELGPGSLRDQRCGAYGTQSACTNDQACSYDAVSNTCALRDVDVAGQLSSFQDSHLMIYAGFAFLASFLTKFGFSALGFHLIAGVLTMQLALFTNTFFQRAFAGEYVLSPFMRLDLAALVQADFATAAIFVSMGAVLGKLSAAGIVLMAMAETVFYSLNRAAATEWLEAADIGGGISIHVFGAYFGLGVAAVLGNRVRNGSQRSGVLFSEHPGVTSHQASDMLAMLGTLVLFLLWPSFNAAAASGAAQHRCVLNSIIALAASASSAFSLSHLLREGRKFHMVDIQNATLAGGVAVAATANMYLQPYGAAAIGVIAGVISTLGFVYVSQFLDDKLKVHDTTGVHNLHGLPGIVGAIASAIMAATATSSDYGTELGTVFPARSGSSRSASDQAGYQMAALSVTIAIALLSGAATGYLLRAVPPPRRPFDDTENWDIDDNTAQVIRDLEKRQSLASRKSSSTTVAVLPMSSFA